MMRLHYLKLLCAHAGVEPESIRPCRELYRIKISNISNESPYYMTFLQSDVQHPPGIMYVFIGFLCLMGAPWSPVPSSLFLSWASPGSKHQHVNQLFTTPVSCYRTSLPCIRSPWFRCVFSRRRGRYTFAALILITSLCGYLKHLPTALAFILPSRLMCITV